MTIFLFETPNFKMINDIVKKTTKKTNTHVVSSSHTCRMNVNGIRCAYCMFNLLIIGLDNALSIEARPTFFYPNSVNSMAPRKYDNAAKCIILKITKQNNTSCWSRSISPYGVTMPSCGNILHWRHNGRNGVSNHQPHHCLLNRLFSPRSRKTSKLRVTGLCAGNSPGTGDFPAQMASNAEDVSIWWRHHELNKHVLSTKANSTKTQEVLFIDFVLTHI